MPMKDLSPEELRRESSPDDFSFDTTADLPLTEDIIGQERATRAIAFGLDVESPGYNIFAMGPAGTGRMTTIRRFVARRAIQSSVPDDWVYVDNFHDERRPRAIRLPAGMGRRLRSDVAEFVADLHRLLVDSIGAEGDAGPVATAIEPMIDELKARYADEDAIVAHLEAVQADVIGRVAVLQRSLRATRADPSLPPPLRRYQVNLLVDNADQEGAPVVVEHNPTFGNLFGRTERDVRQGTTIVDFNLLRPGALHRANGGYLVLRIKDVLADRVTWHALKRALSDGLVRIEEREVPPLGVVTLEPQPIPLDVKVVLLGSPTLYHRLYASDDDFRALFKVKADFSAEIPRTPENERQYALFVRAVCDEEGLRPFDRAGMAQVVTYGSWLAQDQRRLSTRFGVVADLLREAHYWAGEAGRECVTAEDVRRAVDERTYRANRVDEEIRRAVIEGKFFVETEGAVVGQVNALALNVVDEHVFGRPVRITARTYAGRAGVVDIQREIKLSAPSHGKGVLTLTHYLGGLYATRRPLTLSASLSFEQIYDELRGDSASLAELCALISSLADLPVKQGIAVTGSVDQQGQVQPVGGVTPKIEGFYRVCKSRGLTGEQGVIVPAANRRNLVLDDEVVEAVAQGQFHVYAVSTVDEGIEILLDTPPGELDDDGEYPEDSVHGRVVRRLAQLAPGAKRAGDRKASQGKEQDEPEESDALAKSSAKPTSALRRAL